MCGRISFHEPDLGQVLELTGATVDPEEALRYRPRYNIAPSNRHWIVREGAGERSLVPAVWGLRAGKHLAINARAETVDRKFHRALSSGRCLVPATGFYEWTGARGRRVPTWFSSPSGLILMAGLVEEQDQAERFSIITTEANALVAQVHDRMPALLSPEAAERWLKGPSLELLRPAPPEALVARPVSERANDVHHDDPECITRYEPRQPRLL